MLRVGEVVITETLSSLRRIHLDDSMEVGIMVCSS